MGNAKRKFRAKTERARGQFQVRLMKQEKQAGRLEAMRKQIEGWNEVRDACGSLSLQNLNPTPGKAQMPRRSQGKDPARVKVPHPLEVGPLLAQPCLWSDVPQRANTTIGLEGIAAAARGPPTPPSQPSKGGSSVRAEPAGGLPSSLVPYHSPGHLDWTGQPHEGRHPVTLEQRQSYAARQTPFLHLAVRAGSFHPVRGRARWPTEGCKSSRPFQTRNGQHQTIPELLCRARRHRRTWGCGNLMSEG
jgi:hypothetical protein